MGKTSIEWTERTLNPIRARHKATGKTGWHCEHVSEACRHCYAESMNGRFGTTLAYKPGHRDDIEVYLDAAALLAPLKWPASDIFLCSMTDLFADFVPDDWLDRIHAVLAVSPQHRYQLLTKRPERRAAYYADGDWAVRAAAVVDEMPGVPRAARSAACVALLGAGGLRAPLPHVWQGITAEDQAALDARWPHLAATPAAVRFVSYEPALGPLDLSTQLSLVSCPTRPWSTETGEPCGPVRGGWARTHNPLTREPVAPALSWVVAGGESGPHARPPHPAWFRAVRDQCAAAGVPFLFKQWGEWQPFQPPDAYDAAWERSGNSVVAIDGTVSTGDRLALAGVRPAGGPQWCRIRRLGKGRAGRLLDGRVWDEAPARLEVCS